MEKKDLKKVLKWLSCNHDYHPTTTVTKFDFVYIVRCSKCGWQKWVRNA